MAERLYSEDDGANMRFVSRALGVCVMSSVASDPAGNLGTSAGVAIEIDN